MHLQVGDFWKIKAAVPEVSILKQYGSTRMCFGFTHCEVFFSPGLINNFVKNIPLDRP